MIVIEMMIISSNNDDADTSESVDKDSDDGSDDDNDSDIINLDTYFLQVNSKMIICMDTAATVGRVVMTMKVCYTDNGAFWLRVD